MTGFELFLFLFVTTASFGNLWLSKMQAKQLDILSARITNAVELIKLVKEMKRD